MQNLISDLDLVRDASLSALLDAIEYAMACSDDSTVCDDELDSFLFADM